MPNTHMPPDFLQPCLFSIEEAVLKSIEITQNWKTKTSRSSTNSCSGFSKSSPEAQSWRSLILRLPASSLIESIILALDVREEFGADEHLLQNDQYTLGGRTIPYLEMLYATAFTYLQRSARFWRKERGKRGYLSFIASQLPEQEL